MASRACEVLADGILHSRALVGRFIAGFDDSNHTRQAPGMPNHMAWCMGHLALILSRFNEKVSGQAPPETDFAAAPDARRFAIDAVAMGSIPAADPGKYPPCARCIEIFDAACERVATTIRALPESRLNDQIAWGKAEFPIGIVAARMMVHNGIHCGQIADLRRVLALKSVF